MRTRYTNLFKKNLPIVRSLCEIQSEYDTYLYEYYEFFNAFIPGNYTNFVKRILSKRTTNEYKQTM